jgi:quinol monooxygenase YgiN
MNYGYINKFTVQTGKRDELVKLLLQAAEILQSNKDCVQYLVGKASEPETIYVTEIWVSKETHDASLELPEVKTIIAQAMPLIADASNIAEQQIAGGKYSG